MKNDDEYFNDGEFREILEEYENAAMSGQPVFMDADDLIDIAEYYLQQERYDDAQAAFGRAKDADPHSLAVLNYQIHEALHEGDIESAQHYLDRIMERESPEYIYSRAEILIAQDRIDEADKYLRDCFRDVPAEEYQDYVLDVANIYTDYGVSDKAMEWMMRARQENSDDFKELMARTLFGLGKYDDSERIFNELIDSNPFQKRYWNALASTQYMKEDYSASVTSSEYAIAIDPQDPVSIINKANALIRLGNYEEAIHYYDRYAEIASPDEFSLFNKGGCLSNLNRHEEALTVLQQALEISPRDSQLLPQIYQELAFCCSSLKRLDEALHYIDETRTLECDHIEMLVLKGHILLENGQNERAEQVFKNAIIRSNNDPNIILRIIVSLYDNKYVKAAYEMFQKFFSMVVNDQFDQGYSYMALCCNDLGYKEEFLMYLRLAVERNPSEARLVLGHLFPEDMAAKEYYHYMYQKLRK